MICAGGTGGGVYPALAVHNALKTVLPMTEILWVGGEGGMETVLVNRARIPFKSIPAAGIHGVSLRQLPGNIITNLRGLKSAYDILRDFKPDAIFYTGGFVALPLSLVGWKIPSVMYVPDIEPGLALKSLSHIVRRITVTSEDSRQYFSKNAPVVVTGYPVRQELTVWSKNSAREHFGLHDDRAVLLIFGGSKGARSINKALLANLQELIEFAEIIHITGDLDWAEVEASSKSIPAQLSEYYHTFRYLHEDMGAALAAADLVVSRAGASILGEFPLFGLPAILIPYPHAWRYQKVNADTLASKGAAIILDDSKSGNDLCPLIKRLLNDPEKLNHMSAAMKKFASPNAAKMIADQLISLGEEDHD